MGEGKGVVGGLVVERGQLLGDWREEVDLNEGRDTKAGLFILTCKIMVAH